MRIVALVPGGIGEQVLFFPTIETLKRHYPQAQIDIFAEPRAKGAYRVNKFVNEVFNFDFRDRNSLADWGNFVGMLRDREYDFAISLSSNWFVGLLLWLAGITKRIGFKGKGSSFLTNKIERNNQQYVAHTYHDVLKLMGINEAVPELNLNLPKSDLDWTKTQQQRFGISDIGYVLIYPGVVSNGKNINSAYPIDYWVQIIREFAHKQPEMTIIAIQDAENTQIINEIKANFSNLKLLAIDDISKQAAMIASANLLICNESPVLHLAVAVQTYTIVLTENSKSNQIIPVSDKFLAIESPTANLADIPAQTVLNKIWGG